MPGWLRGYRRTRDCIDQIDPGGVAYRGFSFPIPTKATLMSRAANDQPIDDPILTGSGSQVWGLDFPCRPKAVGHAAAAT
jgi:hypothetical protein